MRPGEVQRSEDQEGCERKDPEEDHELGQVVEGPVRHVSDLVCEVGQGRVRAEDVGQALPAKALPHEDGEHAEHEQCPGRAVIPEATPEAPPVLEH